MKSVRRCTASIVSVSLLAASTAWAQSPPPVLIAEQRFDAPTSRVIVVVENRGTVAVYALSFLLRSTLVGGNVLESYRSFDSYSAEAAIEMSIPVSETFINPHERRTFELPAPTSSQGPVSTSTAEIVAVVYADRWFSGRKSEVEAIFERRRQDRDALNYWLAEIEKVAKEQRGRKALEVARARISEGSSNRHFGSTARELQQQVEQAIAADRAGTVDAEESFATLLRLLQARQRAAVVHSQPSGAR